MLILPGLSPMIADTETEAQRLVREVNELTDPEVGRKRLSGRFGGYDFSHLPLDRPALGRRISRTRPRSRRRAAAPR